MQQRGAPHDAVRVDQRVGDKTRRPGAGHELRHVGGIALGPGQEQALAHGFVKIEGRHGQLADLEGVALIGNEVIGHHRGALAQRAAKHDIAVQQRRVALQLAHEALVRFAQPAQHVQVGAEVTLGKHHVEADNGRAGLVQPGDHVRQLVTGPRKLPLGRQAALIDGNDHDPRVLPAGRGQAHPRVIQQVFELLHHADVHLVQGDHHHEHDERERECEADQVTFQRTAVVVRVARV